MNNIQTKSKSAFTYKTTLVMSVSFEPLYVYVANWRIVHQFDV